MQKRKVNPAEDVRTVPMSEHEVDIDCDILETTGLGPCIGVAVHYAGRFSLLHAYGLSMAEPNSFFEELAAAIPAADRASVRPVLAGGYEKDKTVIEDREFVVERLAQLGFGTPVLHWCTKAEDSHDLELDAQEKAVIVTAHPSGRLTKVPF